VEKDLSNLPEDSASLKAMLRSLLAERDREKQRADEQLKRADDLHIQNLRLQLELARYRSGTTDLGQTADSPAELAKCCWISARSSAAADSSGRCPRCERAGVRILRASEAA